MGVLDRARQADRAIIARYLIRSSIHHGGPTSRLHSAEIDRGGCDIGLCCTSSSLWCPRCGDNYLWSGVDSDVTQHIHDLLWLPRCASVVDRKAPGALEAALALIDRISKRQKPMGQLVLSDLSEAEGVVVRTVAGEHGLLAVEHFDEVAGVHMLGICIRGLRLGDVLREGWSALAGLYSRAELPQVAAEIETWGETRRSPALGPDALVSRWISNRIAFDMTIKPWLSGLLLGYPVWTTIAWYHGGRLSLSVSSLTLSLAQHVSRTKRRACGADDMVAAT
jgi:hypothetical protein